MKWRAMVELIGSDSTVHAHEVNAGGSNTAECSAETVGLTLADGSKPPRYETVSRDQVPMMEANARLSACPAAGPIIMASVVPAVRL